MLSVVVVAGLLLSATPSDVEQARAEFERGAALYRTGDFRGALTAFEAAQAHRPAPEALFNIARCQEQLGQLADAVETYRAYLQASPSAPDRASVAARIGELEARLPLEASLRVSVEPPASVSVDDGPPEPSPRSVRVSPGRHRVRAEREGYVPLEREVDLNAGARVQLELSLPPLAPSEEPVRTRAPTAAVQNEVRPATRKTGERRWTWVAAGLSAASLAAGIGFGISAHQAQDKLRDGTPREQPEVQQIYDAAQARNTASKAFYAAAAVTGAAAIALFFIEPHLGAPAEGR
jgi:tetratricopeptide (TPR) repeat protein